MSDKEAAEYYISWLESSYGVLLLGCFLCGTFGNTLSLFYFAARGRGSSSAQIYCFITTSDIFTSLLMLPMSFSYFGGRAPFLFSNPVFCDVWGLLWNIVARYSIFLVAVLSISRTLSLFFPFMKLRVRRVVGVMLGYLALLLLQASVPFWRKQRYSYFPEYVQCFSLLGDLFQYNSPGFIIFYVIFIQLEYTTPLFPILISCGMSITVIRSIHVQSHEKSLATRRRAATWTIVFFTILYIVLNLPAVAFEIIGAVDMYSGNRYNFFGWDAGHRYFRNMITVVSIGLNAAANPLLYFWRMRGMRASTKTRLTGMAESLNFSKDRTKTNLWSPTTRRRIVTVSEL